MREFKLLRDNKSSYFDITHPNEFGFICESDPTYDEGIKSMLRCCHRIQTPVIGFWSYLPGGQGTITIFDMKPSINFTSRQSLITIYYAIRYRGQEELIYSMSLTEEHYNNIINDNTI